MREKQRPLLSVTPGTLCFTDGTLTPSAARVPKDSEIKLTPK